MACHGHVADGSAHGGDTVLDRAESAAKAARDALDARTFADGTEAHRAADAVGWALAGVGSAREDPDLLSEAVVLLRPLIDGADPADPAILTPVLGLFQALSASAPWNTTMPARAETAAELRRLLEFVPEDSPARDGCELVVLGLEMSQCVAIGDYTGLREGRRALEAVLARMPDGTEAGERYR